MSNSVFRSLIYYYSGIINIYIKNFSASDKFVKKGLQVAKNSDNSFLIEKFETLQKKLQEIKDDPRDLIEKLIGLAKMDIKEPFKTTEKKITGADLPEKIYSAKEIRDFYLPIATSKFGDPFEVVETLEKALKMTKNSNDPNIIAERAQILYYLGSAQITIEEISAAEERLKKGLEICKKLKNKELGDRIQRILNTISDY